MGSRSCRRPDTVVGVRGVGAGALCRPQRCALGPCLVEGRLCLIREPPAMLDSIDGALSERTTPRPPERSVINSFDDQEVGEPLDLSHLRLFAP